MAPRLGASPRHGGAGIFNLWFIVIMFFTWGDQAVKFTFPFK